MTVSGGTWLAKEISVGLASGTRSMLTITGGTNVLRSTLSVGSSPNSTGVVSFTGGRLVTTNINPTIGAAGIGQMTVSNGDWLVGSLVLGSAAGSQGTLTFASGSSRVGGLLIMGDSANTTGAVLVTGGTLATTNGSVLVANFGAGQMTVSNGTWKAGDTFNVQVGFNPGSRGTLQIAGGTSTIPSSLILGNFACTATGN